MDAAGGVVMQTIFIFLLAISLLASSLHSIASLSFPVPIQVKIIIYTKYVAIPSLSTFHVEWNHETR